MGKNYPQVFLEECKFKSKKKKMPKYITNNTKIFSDKEYSNEESSGNSDKEYSNEESNFGEAV